MRKPQGPGNPKSRGAGAYSDKAKAKHFID